MLGNILRIMFMSGFAFFVLAVGLDNGVIGLISTMLMFPILIMFIFGFVFHQLFVNRMKRGELTDGDMNYLLKICASDTSDL